MFRYSQVSTIAQFPMYWDIAGCYVKGRAKLPQYPRLDLLWNILILKRGFNWIFWPYHSSIHHHLDKHTSITVKQCKSSPDSFELHTNTLKTIDTLFYGSVESLYAQTLPTTVHFGRGFLCENSQPLGRRPHRVEDRELLFSHHLKYLIMLFF